MFYLLYYSIIVYLRNERIVVKLENTYAELTFPPFTICQPVSYRERNRNLELNSNLISGLKMWLRISNKRISWNKFNDQVFLRTIRPIFSLMFKNYLDYLSTFNSTGQIEECEEALYELSQIMGTKLFNQLNSDMETFVKYLYIMWKSADIDSQLINESFIMVTLRNLRDEISQITSSVCLKQIDKMQKGMLFQSSFLSSMFVIISEAYHNISYSPSSIYDQIEKIYKKSDNDYEAATEQVLLFTYRYLLHYYGYQININPFSIKTIETKSSYSLSFLGSVLRVSWGLLVWNISEVPNDYSSINTFEIINFQIRHIKFHHVMSPPFRYSGLVCSTVNYTGLDTKHSDIRHGLTITLDTNVRKSKFTPNTKRNIFLYFHSFTDNLNQNKHFVSLSPGYHTKIKLTVRKTDYGKRTTTPNRTLRYIPYKSSTTVIWEAFDHYQKIHHNCSTITDINSTTNCENDKHLKIRLSPKWINDVYSTLNVSTAIRYHFFSTVKIMSLRTSDVRKVKICHPGILKKDLVQFSINFASNTVITNIATKRTTLNQFLSNFGGAIGITNGIQAEEIQKEEHDKDEYGRMVTSLELLGIDTDCRHLIHADERTLPLPIYNEATRRTVLESIGEGGQGHAFALEDEEGNRIVKKITTKAQYVLIEYNALEGLARHPIGHWHEFAPIDVGQGRIKRGPEPSHIFRAIKMRAYSHEGKFCIGTTYVPGTNLRYFNGIFNLNPVISLKRKIAFFIMAARQIQAVHFTLNGHEVFDYQLFRKGAYANHHGDLHSRNIIVQRKQFPKKRYITPILIDYGLSISNMYQKELDYKIGYFNYIQREEAGIEELNHIHVGRILNIGQRMDACAIALLLILLLIDRLNLYRPRLSDICRPFGNQLYDSIKRNIVMPYRVIPSSQKPELRLFLPLLNYLYFMTTPYANYKIWNKFTSFQF
ncbi:hypothetical protein SNEBB_010394 [Seison nebaliae]|nr:hypothetical protein SNEBB_010394 [Seison nebaliae]